MQMGEYYNLSSENRMPGCRLHDWFSMEATGGALRKR